MANELGALRAAETKAHEALSELDKRCYRQSFDSQHKHDELELLGAKRPKLTGELPRLTMAEIHDLYFKATGENTRDELDLMPEKLTTAPMSVRFPVRTAISRAMSKSSCWIRMVTGQVVTGMV